MVVQFQKALCFLGLLASRGSSAGAPMSLRRPVAVGVMLLIVMATACGVQSGDSGAQEDASGFSESTETDPCQQTAKVLIETHCANCHSEDLPLAERGGAPMSVNLDTHADIVRHAARIEARALVDQNMPPAYQLEECAQATLESHLASLELACVPQCDFRACGNDGCGGSCGECDGILVCDDASQECVEPSPWEPPPPFCTPDCTELQCGDDGCGGLCGECADGLGCAGGLCLCIPSCDGRSCGDDGCGGSCGTCGEEAECSEAGACECVSDCEVGSCGVDQCGNVCGTCDDPNQPICNTQSNTCMAQCVPNCNGRECGDDGCGGICGEFACGGGDSCDADGQCVCIPDCAGNSCGDDGCGGVCGSCADGLGCAEGACECISQCDGLSCGDDGCGGSCGTCVTGACTGGECLCVPECEGQTCGEDGCGGTCGTCAGGTSCDGTTCLPTAPSFASVYAVIVSNGCTSCHSTAPQAAGLDLSTEEAAYIELTTSTGCGLPLVSAEDAAGSYLIAKLTGVGLCSGQTMPPAPSPLLSEVHLQLITDWIDAGAEP